MSTEEKSIEERLERVENAVAQFQAKGQNVSRNSVFITLLRCVLIVFLGGTGLIAALLSGANYKGEFKGATVDFDGTEFKGALQLFATIAAGGTGALGFGDRLIKAKEKEEQN